MSGLGENLFGKWKLLVVRWRVVEVCIKIYFNENFVTNLINRYTLNTIAAVFVLIGTLFDCGVWYYVKNLKIFDDEIEDAKSTELIEKKDFVGKQEKEEKIEKN